MAIFLFFSVCPSYAANRYWNPAAAANWNSGTAWSLTDGGTPNQAAPTSSDDVFFTSTNNQNCTITASGSAKSISFTGGTGYTGTFTHNNSVDLTMRGSLTFSSGMTYTLGSITGSRIVFGGGTQTLTTAGKTLGRISFLNSGGAPSVTLADALTANSLEVYQGTLNTNNQTITLARAFDTSTTNTRTVNLGSSAITVNALNGAVPWDIRTTTNLTFNAGTSSITINGVNSAVYGGGQTYYAMTINAQTTPSTLDGANTFTNLSLSSGGPNGAVRLAGNQTVSGALTMSGAAQTSRLLVGSDTAGTARTITGNGTISTQYLDLQDITGAGSVSWDLSAITGLAGDAGGNSGVTFTTPATLYWSSNTGNWSDAGKWFLATAGGGGAGRVPLAQDTAIFDASSFSSGSQTVTLNVGRVGTVNWTGVTNTPAFAYGNNFSVHGSLTYVSGMTRPTTSKTISFENRSAITITHGSATDTNTFQIRCYGSKLTQMDGWTSTQNMTVYDGEFDMNSNALAMGKVIFSGTGAKTFTMGSGTLTLSQGDTVWDTSTATNLTVNAGTSTIKLTSSANSVSTFQGAGATYHNLWYARGTSTGVNTITGSNTFRNISDTGTAAHSLKFTAGTTTTITGAFSVNGSSGKVVTLNTDTGASTFTLSKASGYVDCDYLNINNSTATGGAAWYAGANSANTAGNTGWTFTVPPFFTGGNGRGEALGSVTEDVGNYLNIYVGGNGRGEIYAQIADALSVSGFNAFLLSGD